MAIKSKDEMPSERSIDLTGPDGNAFALLGQAKRYASQLDMDFDVIQRQMTSGDYEHLVNTFDKYFGGFVTLYR